MPTQFVRVRYPTDRIVYVDGAQGGRTNRVLRVGQGTHVFDLGPRVNYKPARRKAVLVGTTSTEPLELSFAPLESL